MGVCFRSHLSRRIIQRGSLGEVLRSSGRIVIGVVPKWKGNDLVNFNKLMIVLDGHKRFVSCIISSLDSVSADCPLLLLPSCSCLTSVPGDYFPTLPQATQHAVNINK